MLDKSKRTELTELMQNQFTDIAIIREQPIVFENSYDSNIILVVKPVLFKEHDKFLRDMADIIIDNYEILDEVSFLSVNNYSDQESVQDIISKINIFSADKQFTKFRKDAVEFIEKWAFVSKKKKYVTLKHSKKLCRRYIDNTEPSEFIHILFSLFVMNFDIVKKNLSEFLSVFKKNIHLDTKSTTPTDTSSHGTSQKEATMPKYSREPYNESTLNLFEQQSKI